MSEPNPWSAADEDGISSQWLGDPLRASLKGKRLRRALDARELEPDVLPALWRQILAIWVRKATTTTLIKWESLYTRAGKPHANAVEPLFRTLLKHGELELKEKRAAHGWLPEAVRFTNPQRLRRALGIAEPDEAASKLAAKSGVTYSLAALEVARQALDALPARTALARLELLDALQEWHDSGRARSHATRRDFALFSRGNTKGISQAEWRWLEEQFDLSSLGIAMHAPLLLIAASSRFEWPGGVLELSSVPGFIGLPPSALASIETVTNPPKRWLLLENRTAFEKVVSTRQHGDAVVWLPGYPPSWWRDAMRGLLALAPAPAMIACDPDPDGIAIALQAGALWSEAKTEWHPWMMSAGDLAGLAHRTSLSQRDRDRLDAVIASLDAHSGLATLANWMREHGEKGEQEGLFD